MSVKELKDLIIIKCSSAPREVRDMLDIIDDLFPASKNVVTLKAAR